MFNYGSNYLISGSVAPNRYTSTDPNIYNKWEQCTLFAGVAFFAQRITNVLTGKGLGEFGQAAGRKVLLAFALGGYFGSAFLYAIGYFAGAENRYPYPKVYDECISAANCAPDATVLKEPSLICESGTSTNATQSIMRSCTEEAVEASKNHPDGHPTGAFFILSQGLCGLCAPIGASIYAFVRDVTKDDKAYRVAFGQSVGCGLLSGLLFGFIFGFIFYLGAPLPVFFVLTIFGGLLTGGVPALMACLVIKEPVKPEDRKPMLGKSGAKSVDWSPCHAFMIPFQINRYTACLFISLGLQALLGGMGEFTNVPYLLYAFGINGIDLAVIAVGGYLSGAINNAIVPRLVGLRKATYFGLPSYFVSVATIAFTADPTAKGVVILMLAFVIPILGSSNTTGQPAIYYAQGTAKDTGALSGAWKVGEAFFKLLGGILGFLLPFWTRLREKDPSLVPGFHYLVTLPIYILAIAMWMIADCKYGDQNTLQDEQRIKIFGISAKSANVTMAEEIKPQITASTNSTIVSTN